MIPYFERGGVALYLGDCQEVLTGWPATKDQPDHVITDPPYSEKTHAGARSLKSDNRKGGDGSNKGRIDFAATTSLDIGAVFRMCNAKQWTIATVDWRHVLGLEENPPVGMRFVRFGIWDKPNGAPQFTGDRPATGWEAIAILHSTGARMVWNGGGKRAVWRHNVIRGPHPTQKPFSLLAELIQDFTQPDDLIVDPFAGVGTTLRAAYTLGRRAIGVELEEKWCEIAARELEQAPLPMVVAPKFPATQGAFV